MRLIGYNFIIITLLLCSPVYGTTIEDAKQIFKEAQSNCLLHKTICTFKVIQFERPIAYTTYANITVSSKMIELLTEDELRGVVFHEVAHAVLQHSRQGQLYIENYYIKYKQPVPLETAIKFRYLKEIEADSYASVLLYLNNQPNKIGDALNKIVPEEYHKENMPTHPSNYNRIQNINKYKIQLGN